MCTFVIMYIPEYRNLWKFSGGCCPPPPTLPLNPRVNLVKIMGKQIFKVGNLFSLVCYYLNLEKGVVLTLQSASQEYYMSNVYMKFVQCCLEKLKWDFMFVCKYGVYLPLDSFLLIWRRHHYRLRAAHFGLCSALIAVQQWGSFSVQHLLLTWDIHS